MKKSIYLFAIAACTSFGLLAQETETEETVHINIVKIVDGETITIDTVINASDLESFEKEFLGDDVQNVNVWIDADGSTHKEIQRMHFIGSESMDGKEMKVEVTIDEDGNETILLNGEEISEEELEKMHQHMIIELNDGGEEHVFIMEFEDDMDMEVQVEVDEDGTRHYFLNGEELTEEEFHKQMAEQHEKHMVIMQEFDHADVKGQYERIMLMEEDGEEKEVRVEVDDEGNKHVWINGEEVDPDELEETSFQFWHGEDGKEVIVEEMHVGGKDHKVIILKELDEEGDVEFIREGNEVIEVRHGNQMVFMVRVEVEDANEDELEMLEQGNQSFVGGSLLEADEFKLYPNPSDGEINVEFHLTNKGRTSIQIFDQSAKLVFEEDLGRFEGSWSKKIDLSNFGSGVYFLNLIQGDKAMTKKFIVE
jgi:hypothetical protein